MIIYLVGVSEKKCVEFSSVHELNIYKETNRREGMVLSRREFEKQFNLDLSSSLFRLQNSDGEKELQKIEEYETAFEGRDFFPKQKIEKMTFLLHNTIWGLLGIYFLYFFYLSDAAIVDLETPTIIYILIGLFAVDLFAFTAFTRGAIYISVLNGAIILISAFLYFMYIPYSVISLLMACIFLLDLITFIISLAWINQEIRGYYRGDSPTIKFKITYMLNAFLAGAVYLLFNQMSVNEYEIAINAILLFDVMCYFMTYRMKGISLLINLLFIGLLFYMVFMIVPWDVLYSLPIILLLCADVIMTILGAVELARVGTIFPWSKSKGAKLAEIARKKHEKLSYMEEETRQKQRELDTLRIQMQEKEERIGALQYEMEQGKITQEEAKKLLAEKTALLTQIEEKWEQTLDKTSKAYEQKTEKQQRVEELQKQLQYITGTEVTLEQVEALPEPPPESFELKNVGGSNMNRRPHIRFASLKDLDNLRMF